MKLILTSFFFLLLFSSCKQYADSETEVSMMNLAIPSVDYDTSESKNMNAPPPPSQKISAKIIKTGTLKFQTQDLKNTFGNIQSAVQKYKGNIENDFEGKEYNSAFKRMTVRIPSTSFDAFIADVSKGVAYFDTKEISSEDVTERYIDTEARLKTKKELEKRYLELLKKATKVSEMLEIEAQLSTIREEIESKEGQLKYLQSQVAMSMVSIEFYKTIAQEEGITVSYGSKIWNAIQTGFNGISSFFIWLIEVWPFILILVALIFFIRKRFRKNK
ncbi:hypothetical protein J2X31_003195 [Flavobacterium arsenatis]|uniref:DUF4349 domain-containing protein n=1 Tax=Flavobacterium arsenatis TaxID=1484332 RepID=A0ABU1TTG4_9FLAO|nr:DUF4349 domain-containing protein [Flavobacterium arsenatis]MDR6969168.1 hypothetical protein [Flavobacterium arsenatis]